MRWTYDTPRLTIVRDTTIVAVSVYVPNGDSGLTEVPFCSPVVNCGGEGETCFDFRTRLCLTGVSDPAQVGTFQFTYPCDSGCTPTQVSFQLTDCALDNTVNCPEQSTGFSCCINTPLDQCADLNACEDCSGGLHDVGLTTPNGFFPCECC